MAACQRHALFDMATTTWRAVGLDLYTGPPQLLGIRTSYNRTDHQLFAPALAVELRLCLYVPVSSPTKPRRICIS